MMRTWHFYRQSDGLFERRRYSATSDRDLSSNTPEGCVAIEGVSNPELQRFDLQAKRIVDHVPDAPDADHEWNQQLSAWVPNQNAVEANMVRIKGELEAELARRPDNRETQRRLSAITVKVERIESAKRKPARL